jgi:hypothetical protein
MDGRKAAFRSLQGGDWLQERRGPLPAELTLGRNFKIEHNNPFNTDH